MCCLCLSYPDLINVLPVKFNLNINLFISTRDATIEMTKSKKRQQRKHKKHYRTSRKKLIKRGRKGQTGGNVSRFLPDVKLVNMIPQRSVAFVLAHGCILGNEAAGLRIARRFVLPNNVNIITLASLKKYIDTPPHTFKSGFRVPDKLTKYISQISDNLFEHDNMGSNPTSEFRQRCQKYFSKYFTPYIDPDKQTPGLFDIQNPDGFLHVRNHIYPSEIHDTIVDKWDRGSISIFSNGKSVKFDSYETLGGQHSLLKFMPISVLLCYLFGKEEMQEIITLPHLTVILHTCRNYCNKDDGVTDDMVYSAAADAHATSHVMLGLTLSPGDEVLITGTSNLDLNTRTGVVEERTADGRYGVRISGEPPKSFVMADLRKIVRMSMAPPPPPDTVVLYRLNTDRNKTSSGKIIRMSSDEVLIIQDCYSYEHVEIPNDDVYLIL